MDHFSLPLLLDRFQQVGSYFPHAALERADLQGLIASGGAALQLPKDIAAAPFRIGLEPGGDLLPLSLKGILVGAPPAQDAFSLLLLVAQGGESCGWIGDTPLDRTQVRSALFHSKNANRPGRALVATAPAREAGEAGPGTRPQRSVCAASRREVFLTEAGVARAFSQGRKQSALFCRRVVSTTASWRVGSN